MDLIRRAAAQVGTLVRWIIDTARDFSASEPVIARRLVVWASGGIAAAIAWAGFDVDPATVVTVLVAYLGIADVSATRRTRAHVYPERKVLEYLADAEGAPGAERVAPGEYADRTQA